MDAEKVFEALNNVLPPGARDWVIVLAGTAYVVFYVIRKLVGWIEGRRNTAAERERQEDETRRQKDERYENFLSAELERARVELAEANNRAREAERQEQTATHSLTEALKDCKTLTTRVRYLERLLSRNGIAFKPLTEDIS